LNLTISLFDGGYVHAFRQSFYQLIEQMHDFRTAALKLLDDFHTRQQTLFLLFQTENLDNLLIQLRDFIFVEDCCDVMLWFLEVGRANGIYNLGTGRAQSFNDVALAVVNTLRAAQGKAALPLAQAVSERLIEYVAFPEALRGKYQAYTQADVTLLRAAGFAAPMRNVEQGTAAYVQSMLGTG